MELRNLLHFTKREQLEEAESLPTLLLEAIDYLRLRYQEQSLPESQLQERIAEIYQDYRRSRTYWQTEEELDYGAKVAWRNSSRRVGRIFWQALSVRDLRHLTTAAGIFEALVEHIQLATNGGNLQSTLSIFAPDQPGQSGIRIWNPQLIRYAGYRNTAGTIVGDPAQLELTAICQHLGWQGQGTRFDILPLIIQMPGQKPEWFELPKEVVVEVPILHPEYDWFADLELKWHALPAVSDRRLEIGGISYSCAPFSGWYMSAEIGARNFGDVQRYNLLPVIAQRLGLNTRSKLSLWQDQAMIELNCAVLHSFSICGVTIVDHHSASSLKVFHQDMQDVCLKPNFFPQPPPWTI